MPSQSGASCLCLPRPTNILPDFSAVSATGETRDPRNARCSRSQGTLHRMRRESIAFGLRRLVAAKAATSAGSTIRVPGRTVRLWSRFEVLSRCVRLDRRENLRDKPRDKDVAQSAGGTYRRTQCRSISPAGSAGDPASNACRDSRGSARGPLRAVRPCPYPRPSRQGYRPSSRGSGPAGR